MLTRGTASSPRTAAPTTSSFTTPPSRPTVTAPFRRTSGSSTPRAGEPRARRPSRSSRSSRPVALVSEFGQLGARNRDPQPLRAEVHEDGDAVFHTEDDAEPVFVVRHLIVHGERLGRSRRSWGIEGAGGQVAPGFGAGWLHRYHHAPSVPAVRADPPVSTIARTITVPNPSGRPCHHARWLWHRKRPPQRAWPPAAARPPCPPATGAGGDADSRRAAHHAGLMPPSARASGPGVRRP